MNNKKGIPHYVLVTDVTHGNVLYYFTGIIKYDQYSEQLYPVSNIDHSKALKLTYRDEAEEYVNRLKELFNIPKEGVSSSFGFHVEEHTYM